MMMMIVHLWMEGRDPIKDRVLVAFSCGFIAMIADALFFSGH